jgi:hypothetical protein
VSEIQNLNEFTVVQHFTDFFLLEAKNPNTVRIPNKYKYSIIFILTVITAII